MKLEYSQISIIDIVEPGSMIEGKRAVKVCNNTKENV
jgi:hypothetical protein